MQEFPEYLISDNWVYFKYVCITSIDVVKSFSRYKNILSDNRRRTVIDFEKKKIGKTPKCKCHWCAT